MVSSGILNTSYFLDGMGFNLASMFSMVELIEENGDPKLGR
jgi:hypothetical protein